MLRIGGLLEVLALFLIFVLVEVVKFFFFCEENLVILIGISVKNNVKVFNKFLVFSI